MRMRRGFTLIELLVVVAIIALLISLLLPALSQAKMQARIVRAHSDLRQVCLALDCYMMEYRDQVPPTRQSCADTIQYQLPVELAKEGFFARNNEQLSRVPQAEFFDEFDRKNTYRYLAPGPVYQNGTYFDCRYPRAQIWVPEDFPQCREDEGDWFGNRSDEPRSPVAYAVWSIGPEHESPKFPRSDWDGRVDPSWFPLPRKYWLTGVNDPGLIVHYRTAQGVTYTSP